MLCYKINGTIQRLLTTHVYFKRVCRFSYVKKKSRVLIYLYKTYKICVHTELDCEEDVLII